MVDMGEQTNRFVCPNDRQLALRAKLKTGWSIKTGSLGYNNTSGTSSTTSGGLDPNEQAVILDVIQRAEQLELREQQRVGKLVDRLENMRRNALGRTPSQCLLCGDRFGLLGAQSVQCIACLKLVCQKCAIEAWIGVRRNSGTPGTTGSLKERGERNPRPNYGKWLCKICAETREIWKKSGAWFFKGLPKYILPEEDKKKGGKLVPPSRKCREREEESSSDEEGEENKKGGFLSRINVETKCASVSPNQEQGQGQGQGQGDYSPGQYSRQTSSSDSQKSNSTCSVPYQISINTNTSNTYYYGAHGNLGDSNINEKFGSFRDIREEKGYEKYERYEREKLENRGNEKWDEETAIAVAEAGGYSASYSNMYLGDIFRRDSMASRSISEWTWSDDKTSPSGSSYTSGFKQEDLSPKPISPSAASLSLTLSYDSIRDTLHCLIHRAKSLPAMDINGLADPFCKLNILPDGKLSTRLKTKTVHKTRNPEFNESLTFYEITENDLLKKSVHILVLDDDKYGHDYMGEAKVSLAGLRVQKSLNVTIALEKLLPDDCPLGPDTNLPNWYEDPWCRGQILMSLCYNTKKRALIVTVVRCANLLPMDNNGFSDPFVKMHLKPDPHHKKHKSSIKWKNLNPHFNEEFLFETRPNELSTQSLFITVWDKDYGKSNDYLGGLVLGGAGSKGRRLKHWLDMIRYPDHRHEYWHSLTEDLLTD